MNGDWATFDASIGAGIDSYYEYMYKAAVLFSSNRYMEWFVKSQQAVKDHLIDQSRPSVHRAIHMSSGDQMGHWVESLAAFWPGMLASFGDVEGAKRHWYFWQVLSRRLGLLPDRFDLLSRTPVIAKHPLRPEHIESTYMLYQVTKDHTFLNAAAVMLDTVDAKTATECAFAPIQDVTTGGHDGRMESFWIAETLKYFYLIFDPGILLTFLHPPIMHSAGVDHPLHADGSNWVFTTEGHPLRVPYTPAAGLKRALQCPMVSAASPELLIPASEQLAIEDMLDHHLDTSIAWLAHHEVCSA